MQVIYGFDRRAENNSRRQRNRQLRFDTLENRRLLSWQVTQMEGGPTDPGSFAWAVAQVNANPTSEINEIDVYIPQFDTGNAVIAAGVTINANSAQATGQLVINAGATVTINYLTIQAGASGAAIINSGNLTMTYCNVTAGAGASGTGTGIINDGTWTASSLTITGLGTAIVNNGTATLTNAGFYNNVVAIVNPGTVNDTASFYSGNGTGVSTTGTYHATRVIFLGNNQGPYVASVAIVSTSGSVTLMASNITQSFGGSAITASGGSLLMDQTSVQGNQDEVGDGIISATDESVSIIYATITGNRTVASGTMMVSGCIVRFANSTVTDNYQLDVNPIQSVNSDVTLYNNVIYGNGQNPSSNPLEPVEPSLPVQPIPPANSGGGHYHPKPPPKHHHVVVHHKPHPVAPHKKPVRQPARHHHQLITL